MDKIKVEPRVVWEHDTRRDLLIPVRLIKPWLEANGNDHGKTIVVQLLANGDGQIRWWDYANTQYHMLGKLMVDLDGPFYSALVKPLPFEIAMYGRTFFDWSGNASLSI